MKRDGPVTRTLVPEECIRTAASLFACVHASPSLQNAEQLAQWLGKDPCHLRALDIALAEWGLAQSGHPVGNVPGA